MLRSNQPCNKKPGATPRWRAWERAEHLVHFVVQALAGPSARSTCAVPRTAAPGIVRRRVPSDRGAGTRAESDQIFQFGILGGLDQQILFGLAAHREELGFRQEAHAAFGIGVQIQFHGPVPVPHCTRWLLPVIPVRQSPALRHEFRQRGDYQIPEGLASLGALEGALPGDNQSEGLRLQGFQARQFRQLVSCLAFVAGHLEVARATGVERLHVEGH